MKLFKLLLIIPITISMVGMAGAKEYAKKNTVMADGHPIAVWEKTVENPKGIILLNHGRTWSSLPDFDLQVEGEELSLMDGFNDRGYSVWAMDARGYGETPRDATDWNTPNRSSKDISIVLKWLSEKENEKVHLWGWSMGSMLGHLAAQQYPENIKSLTLFGFPIPFDTVYPEDIPKTQAPKEKTTGEAAASDFIVPGSISQNAIDEYVRHSLVADPVRMDWHYTHQYNELDGGKLSMPVLLLEGEHDPLTHDDAYAALFQKLPNANKQWVVLKGGDHAALLEKSRGQLIDASINFIEWLEK
ncbi:MAG: alpha/beta fold hydrolase [Emcibacteraceae bacterium]|nr:alpha/beta fold hydrolase [Emcibacteraceae bacterium]